MGPWSLSHPLRAATQTPSRHPTALESPAGRWPRSRHSRHIYLLARPDTERGCCGGEAWGGVCQPHWLHKRRPGRGRSAASAARGWGAWTTAGRMLLIRGPDVCPVHTAVAPSLMLGSGGWWPSQCQSPLWMQKVRHLHAGESLKAWTLAPATRQRSRGATGRPNWTVNHAWGGGGVLEDQDWFPLPSAPCRRVTCQPVLQTSASLTWFPR